VRRRGFLTSAFAGALSARPGKPIPIIDSHIHLFDVKRPQGVPWPPKDSPIYRSALPNRYRGLAARHGIVGAIEIECSPWSDDNQWVLDVAAKDTIVVGTIGNLEPGTPAFPKQLERLHRNPLFRGIRYGNLWNRNLGAQLSNPDFIRDLKLLASTGLVLDTANPDPPLMQAVLRLSDRIPDLKIMLDHLPELTPPRQPELRQLAQRTLVFAKVSGIVRRADNHVPLDLAFYQDRLDYIWSTFGPDKLLYGSDWPNSDQWAQYPDVFRLADEFIKNKDQSSIGKFFWRNSLNFYAWVKRAPNQPQLA
jgi:L-fuconolactonase